MYKKNYGRTTGRTNSNDRTYHGSCVIIRDIQGQLVPIFPGSILKVESPRLPANPHSFQVHGVAVPDARCHRVIAAVRGIRAANGR